MMKRLIPFFIIAPILVLIPSCKVGYSFTGASIPAEAETISVQRFPNHAGLGPPTLGQTFTEDLRERFMQQTDLALVERNGDLRYSGSIVGYNIEPVAVQGNKSNNNQQGSLNRLTITVKVRYRNTINEEKNFEKKFSRYADFEASKNLSTVEDRLIKEIDEQLTQDIFDASLSDW